MKSDVPMSLAGASACATRFPVRTALAKMGMELWPPPGFTVPGGGQRFKGGGSNFPPVVVAHRALASSRKRIPNRRGRSR
jgi:hypothetical protein